MNLFRVLAVAATLSFSQDALVAAAGPTFEPGVGSTAQAIQAGQEGAMSLMERAQIQKQREYEFQQQQIKDRAQAPIAEAQQKALIAEAKSRADAFTAMAEIRKQWYDSLKIEDIQLRLAKQESILTAATRFRFVKEIDAEVKSWQENFASNLSLLKLFDSGKQIVSPQGETKRAREQASGEAAASPAPQRASTRAAVNLADEFYLPNSGTALDDLIPLPEQARMGISKLTVTEREQLRVYLVGKLIETNPPETGAGSASATTTKPAYRGANGKHWIDNNMDGEIIVLEDDSVWAVDSLDRVDALLWLPTDDITVLQSNKGSPGYDYMLVNTDDKESVNAKFLGMR
jgi:hypothetical protein